MVATGIWQPASPHIEGSEYFDNYETVSTNPDDFEGQTVLILGQLLSVDRIPNFCIVNECAHANDVTANIFTLNPTLKQNGPHTLVKCRRLNSIKSW